MSAISTDERREVARRLRETGEELESAALLWYHIAKALGVRTATDGKTACDMLADLIEPAQPHYIVEVKISGDELEGYVNRVITEYTGIDRDALLKLADELDMCADGCRRSDRAPLTAEEVWECASRIREACGEVER